MINNCTRCALANTRRNMVIGNGSVPADILFIGDGPTQAEELVGRPFVGQYEKLINTMLDDAGLQMTWYATNMVLCHAPNHEPSSVEVLTCMENVLKIAERVNAKHTVFLGKLPQKYLKKHFPGAVTILHPSFLLRDGGLSSSHYIAQVRKLEVFDGC